jgi:hypothetical protein
MKAKQEKGLYFSQADVLIILVVLHSQFAGFDPFKRSEYFGPFFDLGQVKLHISVLCFASSS